MRTNISIIFLLSCCVFLLESCECNDGEIIIPCSIKVDLGTFENENDLPYGENEIVEFENEAGGIRTFLFNEPSTLNIFIRQEVPFIISNHISLCAETLSEKEFTWQEEQYIGLRIGLNDGILIQELSAVDIGNPEAGVVGEYFTVKVRGRMTGGFSTKAELSFSENKIQTSQQSSYDFGYEFFERITFNGREFENVVRALDTQSDKITQLYFSNKGVLIAFEDVDDGLFVLK